MSTDSRGAFEAWVHSQWPHAPLMIDPESGEYIVQGIQDNWEGWQAARAATAREAHEAINALIKPGDLGGDGWDKDAERNGIVLAANVLSERFGVHPST